MSKGGKNGRNRSPAWEIILTALLGYGCLIILFPVLVFFFSRPFIDFELSHLLWLYGIFGGTYTRTTFDSALLLTSDGMLPVQLSLFNSSVTFFCLFIVIAVLLRGIPVERRVVALVVALPVLYLGSIVRFFLIFHIKDLIGAFSLPVFEVTTGAVVTFLFTILAFMAFAYMLLPQNVRDMKIRAGEPAEELTGSELQPHDRKPGWTLVNLKNILLLSLGFASAEKQVKTQSQVLIPSPDPRDLEQIRYCSNCGKKIPHEGNFCPFCRSRIHKTGRFKGWPDGRWKW
jgi:hypothetical protein